jgi:hypothetical protein
VAGVVGGLALAAAALFVCKKRRQQQWGKGRRRPMMQDLEMPLLNAHTTAGDSSGDVTGTSADASVSVASSIRLANADAPAGGALLPINSDTDTTADPTEVQAADADTAGAKAKVVQLPFSVLEEATAGFAVANEIGGGASCKVFSGVVSHVGVAVKRLKEDAVEWEAKQFHVEMTLLTSVAHENICRLLAFSTDGPQRCLVLELCEGGALDQRLACKAAAGDPAAPAPLEWDHRVQLVVGVARALSHLHSQTPPLIHRDLKSPNVLLDAAGNAKVADFGTVRDMSDRRSSDATHASTKVAQRAYYAARVRASRCFVLICLFIFAPPLRTARGRHAWLHGSGVFHSWPRYRAFVLFRACIVSVFLTCLAALLLLSASQSARCWTATRSACLCWSS